MLSRPRSQEQLPQPCVALLPPEQSHDGGQLVSKAAEQSKAFRFVPRPNSATQGRGSRQNGAVHGRGELNSVSAQSRGWTGTRNGRTLTVFIAGCSPEHVGGAGQAADPFAELITLNSVGRIKLLQLALISSFLSSLGKN